MQPDVAAQPDEPPMSSVPPPPQFDRLAVVTIEGGGIYGLNLLGQLSHLTEKLNIVPVAVAGNSAGSIVAALYWAGYAPWEIRNLFVGMADRKELTALVGPFVPQNDPYTLSDFRTLKDDCEQLADRHLGSDQPVGFFRGTWRCVTTPFRCVSELLSLRSIRNRIMPHYKTRGCFHGVGFIDKIDDLIRSGPLLNDRNVPTGQGIRVKFGDVRRLVREDPTFCAPALFLTATNVTGKRLEVFNSIDDRYDDVPIAEAVRASCGFPAFFRPIEFKDDRYAGWYADGGIVSNYPAWIFSKAFRLRLVDSPEYRQLATRPWVHFGLRLERSPNEPAKRTTDPKLFVSSLARLVLGGEARTALDDRLEELVTRSFTIQQPSARQLPSKESGISVPKDLLDIDAISAPVVNEMYRLGKEESRRPRSLSFALPEREVIERPLSELIEQVLLVFGQQDNTQLLLRSNVFIPSVGTLRMRYAVNMDPPEPGAANSPTANNDYDLCLPLSAGLTGACMTARRPLLCNLQKLGQLRAEGGEGGFDRLFGMPENLQAKVRQDRTWLASVPIFDPFASYPRELSIPTSGDLPHPTVYTQGLAGRTDGAVFGVLNLDAGLQYGSLSPVLDANPSNQLTDRRIQAVLHLMAATSAEVGEHLSHCFARQQS